MIELLFEKEVYAIVGAAMAVHRELGPGFLEAVYQEALETENRLRQIPSVPQQALAIRYKGHVLKKEYIADFVCYGKIIVEIKALDRLTTKEDAQVLNYLKATGFELGVLINFGSPYKLEWKRLARSHSNLYIPRIPETQATVLKLSSRSFAFLRGSTSCFAFLRVPSRIESRDRA